MKIWQFLAEFGAGALVIFACSSAVPVSGAPKPDASVSLPSGEPHWNVTIRSVPHPRFDQPDSSARERSYGSAVWSRGERPSLSKVSITFSYGGPERSLSWAILFGNCGTGSMTLLPISNFPEIEVGSGGHADVEATLTLELPTSGNYHLDIYRDRQGSPESVVGCGNLRYSAG